MNICHTVSRQRAGGCATDDVSWELGGFQLLGSARRGCVAKMWIDTPRESGDEQDMKCNLL